MAKQIARSLSPFQKEAIVAIGDFGETGLWASSPLVNWIALAPILRKKGIPALLENVPGQSGLTRLTPFGQKIRNLLKGKYA